MRVIICGGRDFSDHEFLNSSLDELHESMNIQTVVHGDARGADRMAAQWAYKNKIQVIPYPADWNRYGNGAGPIRNAQMLKEENPDCVIAFPGGVGTDNMKSIAMRANVPVIDFSEPEEVRNSLF